MNSIRYNNREISWLKFNERVLLEAIDNDNPIMEKLKFLAIFTTNLDEFFMIRVAGLKDQIALGYDKKDISENTATEQLNAINDYVKKLITTQNDIFEKLKTELLNFKIIFNADIDEELNDILESIFINEISPILSPITLDPNHPFPFIYNKRFSIIIKLEKNGKVYHSLLMLPENLKRAYKVQYNSTKYIFKSEDIILRNLNLLYRGYKILSSDIFRVTRNADFEVQKEEASDLVSIIKDSISKRNKGEIARVEINHTMSKDILSLLQKEISFKDDDIFLNNNIDLSYLFTLTSLLPDKQYTKHSPFTLSDTISGSSIFDIIKENDILFFRPFYSFHFVSKLIAIAAYDEDVLAIKMTLYRTDKDSSILSSLIEAARKGKQVSVVVELKARFDEERNITWATNLEREGCIVSYGIPNLKVHAKCLHILRKENNQIKRYTHIATGNYNENTANLYTDIDLITADDKIGRDATELFNYLMGYTDIDRWEALFIAPFNIKTQLINLIDSVITDSKISGNARIIMKMNSMVDSTMIDKLYAASDAKVNIDLIVRGICCLKPEVEGLSENIHVKSIIGRFLEHSRVYYFKSETVDKLYISSADLMPRNLNGRVELMVEITDSNCKNYILEYLDILLKDSSNSWLLNDDSYTKNYEGSESFDSQDYLTKYRLIK